MIFTIHSRKYGYFGISIDDELDFILQNKWTAGYDPSNQRFYISRILPGRPRKTIKLHRVIMEHYLGRKLNSKEHIDHINGDTTDNRIQNLRVVNNRQNHQNRKSHREGRLVGCYFSKRNEGWVALIRVGKKRKNLGLYPTEQQAHHAYIQALEEYSLNLSAPI